MTTNRFRVHLASLLLVAGLSSCADHLKPEPGPDRLRVKTLTQTSSDAPGIRKVSTLTYDGQGRLSAILAYQSPDSTLVPVEQNTYQYDALNRLTKHRRQFYRRPLILPSSLPDLLYEEEEYVYGPTGPPTQLLYFNNTGGGPLWYTVDLAYSSTTGRLLSARQRLSPTNGVSYRVYRTFTFTGDNITSVDADYSFCAMGGPCNTGLVTSAYTFDDKLNPFYGVYVIPIPTGRVIPVLGGILTTEDYYGGVDNLFNLSRNNVLTGNGPVYTYTYNSANLPTSRSTTDRFGLTTTLTFDYETY
jgi:YD repeat-containing protein